LNTYDPLAEFDQMLEQQRQREATEQRNRPQVDNGGSEAVKPWYQSAFETVDAFVYGVADTVTFGYMDEIGGTLDHKVLGRGESVQDAMNTYRENVAKMAEEYGTSMFLGQLAGGFVPVLGAVGRGASLRSLLVGGAAYGGLYGSGSANGDLSDRAQGAAIGAGLGLALGYTLGGVLIPAAKWGGQHIASVFRHGQTPKLDIELPAPKLATATDAPVPRSSAAPDAPAASPPRTNIITGQADDQLEDGAVLSLKELLGDPGAARAALNKRLGTMSAEEAQKLLARIEQAELSGDVLKDPHYRSLLGLDISDAKIDPDDALRAIGMLEEATEAIRRKAGQKPIGFGQQTREFNERLEEGVVMADLEEAVKASRKGYVDGRIATNAQMLAGITLVRARQQLLPEIKKGVEGARERLAETITKASHMLAVANAIKSNFGRNLGSLRNAGKFALDDGIADDLIEVPSLEALRKRVDSALKDLGDEDMIDLLGRLRTLEDVNKLDDILTNAESAKAFGLWRRTMNSVSTFLKSNALTPATGLFNTISFVGHDFFRNTLAKGRAARRLKLEGRMDEATALRFELDVANGVYWEAHKRGLKALMQRVRWEFWGDVERIAAVAWNGGKAGASRRQAMLDKGYAAPDLREFQQQPRLAVTDTKAFNARMAGGGAFGSLVNRLMATTANVVDATGQASMKLFTGAIDDWGRNFVVVKETYALSARQAIREAMETQAHLGEKEMLDWASKRARELAEMPPADILAKAEAKLLKGEDLDDELVFFAQRDKAVELEAERTLFMDGPQTVIGRASATIAQGADNLVGLRQVQGILLPYIRTPIRLFERGLVSYTPWGAKSKEVQAILNKGGVQAEIVKAQMEIGTWGIGLGMLLGTSGVLKLTNGGFTNTGNLETGAPNRIEIGGKWFEVGRLDPFAITLALGGFLGQALNAGFREGTEYEAQQGFETALSIAWLAIRDSVLEKSYLNGLQDLMEVMFARNEGSAVHGLEKMAINAFTRMIPMAGTWRQINDTIRGQAPEAIGWMDNMLRAIPGAGIYMDPRVDALGNEVESRFMGVAFGDSNSNQGQEISEVTRQLRDLGIDITNLKKADRNGLELTSSELTQLRRIRGKEAQVSGLTMEQALQQLMGDPFFQNLPSKEQKEDMVVELMSKFNEPARQILESRDPNYAANRAAYKSLADYMAMGMSREDARTEAIETNRRYGLQDPDRL
jgi:hypothetical protein